MKERPADVRVPRVVSAAPAVAAVVIAVVLALTTNVSVWGALLFGFVALVLLGAAVAVWEQRRAFKAGFRPVKRHAFGYTTWKRRR